MSDYRLTTTDTVIRTADQTFIPNDPANRDRIEYDKWLAAGGVPDPYVPPVEPAPPVAEPTPIDDMLYDHENRLRSLEGQPPLTQEEFTGKMT